MGFTEKKFSGKWQGQYTYGDGYDESHRGKSVLFTLVMEVDGRGRLKGHIVDDGYADQIDARATIEGTVVGGEIRFVKTYRHHWGRTPDGNLVENKKRPSHDVHYAGQFSSLYCTGEWKIFSSAVRPDGSIREWSSGGHWIMHRAEMKDPE
jgi:hypothetical protein